MTREDDIEIRNARAPEIGKIGQILRDSFVTTMAPIVPDEANTAFAELNEPERFAENCWQDFQVLVSEGDIKGMLFVVDDKIESIHLDPSQKRRGYGSLLLSNGEKSILENGYPTAKLDVLMKNRSAIAFYLAQGWHIDHEFTGLEVGDVPVPMYRMHKDLNVGSRGPSTRY